MRLRINKSVVQEEEPEIVEVEESLPDNQVRSKDSDYVKLGDLDPKRTYSIVVFGHETVKAEIRLIRGKDLIVAWQEAFNYGAIKCPARNTSIPRGFVWLLLPSGLYYIIRPESNRDIPSFFGATTVRVRKKPLQLTLNLEVKHANRQRVRVPIKG